MSDEPELDIIPGAPVGKASRLYTLDEARAILADTGTLTDEQIERLRTTEYGKLWADFAAMRERAERAEGTVAAVEALPPEWNLRADAVADEDEFGYERAKAYRTAARELSALFGKSEATP